MKKRTAFLWIISTALLILAFLLPRGKQAEAADKTDVPGRDTYALYTQMIRERNQMWADARAKRNEHLLRAVDMAGLLTSDQREELESELKKLRQKWNFDLVIVTTDSIGSLSAEAYADDFFDYVGYGMGSERDGALLLVSMEDRDWAFSTSSYGITAFTDAGIDYIMELVLPDLSEEHYTSAFETLVEQAGKFLRQAKNGKPYDVNNMPKSSRQVLLILVASMVIGAIVSFIVLGTMKAKLTSVKKGTDAKQYAVQDSFALSEEKDTFLYKNVTKVRIETSSGGGGGGGGSSRHFSSSGRSHGGRSGKF